MSIYKVIILAVCTALICLVLKQSAPHMTLLAELCGALAILAMVVGVLAGEIEQVYTMVQSLGIQSYIRPVIKCLGICYLTQIGHDTCIDAGCKALAGQVMFAGKTALLVVLLPETVQLIKTAGQVIQ